MSRSGYSDGLDHWDLIKWRGQVASAIRGKRGQRLLRDLLESLEAMENRQLHAGVFDDGEDCVCALGAVARLRDVRTDDIDPECYCADDIAGRLDIAHQLAAEVMFINDEGVARTPEQRWSEVYGWAQRQYQGPRLPHAPRPDAAFFSSSLDINARPSPCTRRPLSDDECEFPLPSRRQPSSSVPFHQCKEADQP